MATWLYTILIRKVCRVYLWEMKLHNTNISYILLFMQFMACSHLPEHSSFAWVKSRDQLEYIWHLCIMGIMDYGQLHTHTRTHIHTYTHTYTRIHTRTHTHTYTHMYTHTHTHTCTHTHTHTHNTQHTRTHTHTHTHVHTHVHTHIHTSHGVMLIAHIWWEIRNWLSSWWSSQHNSSTQMTVPHWL